MRRTLAVAVLALLGFIAGAAVTELGARSYIFTAEFNLRHGRDASYFASVARSQHVQGIRVRVLDGNTFQVTGHGSADGAVSAVEVVARQVRRALDRVPDMRYSEISGGVHALARPQGNALQTGAIGLLAGLGVGLGIVVPHGRRVTAVPS